MKRYSPTGVQDVGSRLADLSVSVLSKAKKLLARIDGDRYQVAAFICEARGEGVTWIAIGDYIGKSGQTVQKWSLVHREFGGMPAEERPEFSTAVGMVCPHDSVPQQRLRYLKSSVRNHTEDLVQAIIEVPDRAQEIVDALALMGYRAKRTKLSTAQRVDLEAMPERMSSR